VRSRPYHIDLNIAQFELGLRFSCKDQRFEVNKLLVAYMYLKACAIVREVLNIILKCKSLYVLVRVLIFINLQRNKMFLKKSKLYLILLL